MARQARLAIAGLTHYVLLRGHNGLCVFRDAVDRELFRAALRESTVGVALQACALLDHEAHLLLRPDDAASLSQAMQALGRRFVASYNRRHARSGTPWDGRFRAALVEPGAWTLAALRRVDGLAQRGAEAPLQPLRWQPGAAPDGLVDPPELWALGNTPFERERAYAELLAQPLLAEVEGSIDRAVRSGRVIGGEEFLRGLSQGVERPLVARPRGRPRRRLE